MKKPSRALVRSIIIGLLVIITFISLGGWVHASSLKAFPEGSGAVLISYQGQIWEDDKPYDGDGYFRFAIIGEMGDFYWSNDGNYEPESPILLTVQNGLFSLNLGDPDLDGMKMEITADVFRDPHTYLQVWFSPDDMTWTQMPDQPIAAVPYALQAQQALEANNAAFLDSQAASAFQLRVTGSCPAGQAIKSINANGSVVCESIPQTATFSISYPDSGENVGWYNALAIGQDGLGLISYYDNLNMKLKVAHCLDTSCTSAETFVADDTPHVGKYNSIAIGRDGFGLISYFDEGLSTIRVLHCLDIACSTSEITYVGLEDAGGYDSSIAIGVDGFGLITFYDSVNSDLEVVHCENVSCSSATPSTLDAMGTVGLRPSIAIGMDGLGLISYYDFFNHDLKVAHCADIACTAATKSSIDTVGIIGFDSDISIGADGLGIISYRDVSNLTLKLAHCDDEYCSGATFFTVDSNSFVGAESSIAIGADGLPFITYYDATNTALKVAHCNNALCTSPQYYILDSTENVGEISSVAIGMDGFPLISYSEKTAGNIYDLKVAHCSNRFCNPDE